MTLATDDANWYIALLDPLNGSIPVQNKKDSLGALSSCLAEWLDGAQKVTRSFTSVWFHLRKGLVATGGVLGWQEPRSLVRGQSSVRSREGGVQPQSVENHN